VRETPLVLSLFPGIGLLDYAFELEGFCIVRGPDVLWGGDIRRFSPPAGVFDGVIGGPPCQPFSRLVHIVRANGYEPRHGNLIPDFERVVSEAAPSWFLMEEVPAAPLPDVPGYVVRDLVFDNRWSGAEQHRVRRFSFGSSDGRRLPVEVAALESATWEPAVASDARGRPVKFTPYRDGILKEKPDKGTTRRPIGDMLRLQGLPDDWLDECPLTESGKRTVIGNGVPIPTGRTIARAIRRAFGLPILSKEAVS
jgi:DNA (cytosine-5)-methyltransferase 1